jgi:hypothetical protein
MPTYVRDKSIRVIMTADPKAPDGVRFTLNANNGNGPVQQVRFDNNGHPGILVYFNIEDDDNTGLLFQPVPSDALWVNYSAPGAPAPPCPINPAAWDGFIPVSVEDNGNQLIVYCRNLDKQFFRFALRFLGPNGPVNYDPIGDGNNGMRS